jgi:hypothetical protein
MESQACHGERVASFDIANALALKRIKNKN